jgi:hypothetical protein
LPKALAAASVIYGPAFNPQLTLKALCCFQDGNVPALADEIRRRLEAAVRATDPLNLPKPEELC